jgi:hypothetical protein
METPTALRNSSVMILMEKNFLLKKNTFLQNLLLFSRAIGAKHLNLKDPGNFQEENPHIEFIFKPTNGLSSRNKNAHIENWHIYSPSIVYEHLTGLAKNTKDVKKMLELRRNCCFLFLLKTSKINVLFLCV